MKTFILYVTLAVIALRVTGPEVIVSVTGGQIRGALLEKGGAVFKGIPYAQPPVNDLRWREPMPVKGWAGVRDSTAFGAPCMQKPNIFAPGAGEVSSEDCLYLNIWTPEWPPNDRYPVMVWIPGGGNVQGTASQALYDGTPLVSHGVVVVTIDYRLGVFGFFAHPELSKESPHHVSGNQGILDQIAALRWVRDNISKFGGDATNVTIFGESAGSLDVSVLMTSPLSNGLFRRVIAESGAVVGLGSPDTLHDAEDRGALWGAQQVNKPTASLKDLRAVPAQRLLAAQSPFDQRDLKSLRIVVDGYVFPDAPAHVFAKGAEHRVALLMGSNARERLPNLVLPTDLRSTIEQTYGPLASRAVALYGGADSVQSDADYGTPAEQWATDTTFRCGAVSQLAWHAAAGNPAFEYEFARVPVGNEKVGATHASELSYVFGTLDHVGLIGAPPVRVTAEDRQVSQVMQQYWTNFAKTGNPNGGKLPRWPQFNTTSRSHIQFTSDGPIAKQALRRPYCDLFIENVNRLLKE